MNYCKVFFLIWESDNFFLTSNNMFNLIQMLPLSFNFWIKNPRFVFKIVECLERSFRHVVSWSCFCMSPILFTMWIDVNFSESSVQSTIEIYWSWVTSWYFSISNYIRWRNVYHWGNLKLKLRENPNIQADQNKMNEKICRGAIGIESFFHILLLQIVSKIFCTIVLCFALI